MSFGLRTKITALLVVLITIVFGVVTWFMVRNQVQQRQQELVSQTQSVARVFGLQYAHSLLTSQGLDDVERIGADLWLQRHAEARLLQVYDGHGELLYNPNSDIPSLDASNLRKLVRSDRRALTRWDSEQQLLDVLVPIREFGTVLGVLRVGMDTAAIQREQQYTVLMAVGSMGGFWILAMVVGILGTRPLFRPLEELVSVTRELGEGNLDTRAEVTTGDEIGELANQFNTMADSIQQRIREQEEQVRQLEAIQDVAQLMNESSDPEVLFTVLEGSLETLYEIEQFIGFRRSEGVLVRVGEPELDVPRMIEPSENFQSQFLENSEPRSIAPPEALSEELPDSVWTMPLVVGETLYGLLFMELREQPDERQISWMEIWATQLAQTLRGFALEELGERVRLEPVSALVDDVNEFIESESSPVPVVQIRLADYLENRNQTGVLYGEDLAEQLAREVDGLTSRAVVRRILPDRFILVSPDITSDVRQNLERWLGSREESLDTSWTELSDQADLIEFLVT